MTAEIIERYRDGRTCTYKTADINGHIEGLPRYIDRRNRWTSKI